MLHDKAHVDILARTGTWHRTNNDVCQWSSGGGPAWMFYRRSSRSWSWRRSWCRSYRASLGNTHIYLRSISHIGLALDTLLILPLHGQNFYETSPLCFEKITTALWRSSFCYYTALSSAETSTSLRKTTADQWSARQFRNLWQPFNLQQHVNKPRHTRGNPLELVVNTFDWPVEQVHVDLLDPICDHLVVRCCLPLTHRLPHVQSRKLRCWHLIDRVKFTDAIKASAVNHPLSLSDVNRQAIHNMRHLSRTIGQ